MSAFSTFRFYADQRILPVVFLSKGRPAPEPAPVVPEAVGLRWGRASDFDFSATSTPEDQGQGSLITEGDEEAEIYGTEVFREYAKDQVPDPDSVAIPVPVEAIKSVTFYIGTREVWRPVKSGNLQMLFLTQIVDEYLKLTFPVISGPGGDRGEEAPDDSADPPGAEPIAPGYQPLVTKEYQVPVDRSGASAAADDDED